LAARAPVRPDSPTFAELGARPETVAALAAVGITRAFAIQEYALPIALRGADLIGQAPTGTGKTLGFGVPLLDGVSLRTRVPTARRRRWSSCPPVSSACRSPATSRPPARPAASACCRSTAAWPTSPRSML
jgi:superfamily II DNA/RNA helicase